MPRPSRAVLGWFVALMLLGRPSVAPALAAAEARAPDVTRVRFVGPLAWDWLYPDPCRTRADGLVLRGSFEVMSRVARDTELTVTAEIRRDDGTLDLPICCSCSIWHPTQYFHEPPLGLQTFEFQFCGGFPPSAHAMPAGRFQLRLGLGGETAPAAEHALAETTLTLPAIPARRFERPRHRIGAFRERGLDRDRDGRLAGIEIVARVATDCQETTRLGAWLHFDSPERGNCHTSARRSVSGSLLLNVFAQPRPSTPRCANLSPPKDQHAVRDRIVDR